MFGVRSDSCDDRGSTFRLIVFFGMRGLLNPKSSITVLQIFFLISYVGRGILRRVALFGLLQSRV